MIKIDGDYTDYRDDDDPGYPGGKAVDCPDENSYAGTPYKAVWMNDINGFRQALFVLAFGSLAALSGKPDSVLDSDSVKAITRLLENQKDEIMPLIREIVETKAPKTATLADEAANSALPATSKTELTALLQTTRNALKWLIAGLNAKAPLADPVFTGTPQVPAKSGVPANNTTYIATEGQVKSAYDSAYANAYNNAVAQIPSNFVATSTSFPVGTILIVGNMHYTGIPSGQQYSKRFGAPVGFLNTAQVYFCNISGLQIYAIDGGVEYATLPGCQITQVLHSPVGGMWQRITPLDNDLHGLSKAVLMRRIS
jgi:hypothetical protein